MTDVIADRRGPEGQMIDVHQATPTDRHCQHNAHNVEVEIPKVMPGVTTYPTVTHRVSFTTGSYQPPKFRSSISTLINVVARIGPHWDPR